MQSVKKVKRVGALSGEMPIGYRPNPLRLRIFNLVRG